MLCHVRVGWKDLTNGGREFYSFGILGPGRATPGHRSVRCSAGPRAASLRDRGRAAGRSARRAPCLHLRDSDYRRDESSSSGTAGDRSPAGTTWSGPTLDDIPDDPDARRTHRAADHSRPTGRTVWEAVARSVPLDHRDEEEWTEADWATFQGDYSPTSRPGWIAFEGDEVAGGIWNRTSDKENAYHGRHEGSFRPRLDGLRAGGAGAWPKALIVRSPRRCSANAV